MKPSIQWLLVLMPVAAVLDRVGGTPPALVFFAAALAIVPAAALIVRSTEQLAQRTGAALGGLLNATFGNAPELIIALTALHAGLTEMVLASIVGALLANLLFALGLSLLLGGLGHHVQEYNARAIRIYSSMMLLAVISLVAPSAFARFFSAPEFLSHVEALNTWMAVLLLAVYGLYLFFMLGTHSEDFSEVRGAEGRHEEGPAWSVRRAVVTLVTASLLAAWMSEILVGAAEGTGEALGMSQAFIGLVIVAVVGGAAESFSAISAARNDDLDLAFGIAFGSCIQIALFVAPLLVILSPWVGPAPLHLEFGRAELGCLFLGVLISAVSAGDGRGNWFKGVQLLAVYLVMALLFYFVPASAR